MNRLEGKNPLIAGPPSCIGQAIAARFASGAVVVCAILACAPPLLAQQKAQYVPGQYGLNAGVIPDPGFTYMSMNINYSADSLMNSDGNPLPSNRVYSFWALENIFMYVPRFKILGGYLAPFAVVTAANGSLTLERVDGGINATGLADTYVQPLNLGWHLSRADVNAGYGFMAPTGRYSANAIDNIGSGYWGHNLTTGTTAYITKNKGTSANLFTDYEIHGKKEGTNVTPGQAFSMEWGLGQVLPLDKQLNKLVQIGVVGYDQWQVSSNGGTLGSGISAGRLPYYSVHAIGCQGNFIVMKRGLMFFFKYEPEYMARAHPQGRIISFGGSWTLGRAEAAGP